MAAQLHVPDFRVPRTAAELARHCGVDPELFAQVIADKSRKQFYLRHEIPKKRRELGTRTVWEAAEDELKDAHKAVARRLDLFARDVEKRYPNTVAYGYVRGRGTLDNAERHCGAPFLVRADLRSFFPSIRKDRLVECLLALGFHRDTADALGTFCTINDRLALGLHASPLLSNLVCLDLDDDLIALSQRLGCVYTRYADDMAFSGRGAVPTRRHLEQVVGQHGFQLSTRKYRFTKRGQAHYVTGLSVSDPVAPHVPRRMKRLLRQELYYVKKHGLEEHLGRRGEQSFQEGTNRIDGLVRYVSGIERGMRGRLRRAWGSILEANAAAPSYMPVEGRPLRRISFIVDEAEFETTGGSKYLAVAVATTQELEKIRCTVRAAAREYRADTFAPGRPEKVDAKGLHFTDLPETIRDTFARALSFEPFRAYVAFAPLPQSQDYASTYVRLLALLLKRRLQAADRGLVTIFVEQNSSVSQSRVEQMVSHTYDELERAGDRRPVQQPSVIKAEKGSNPEISIPDFLLGVVGHYLKLEDSRPSDFRRLRFERLRDKVRIVIDVERRQEFSRRNPLVPWSSPPLGSRSR